MWSVRKDKKPKDVKKSKDNDLILPPRPFIEHKLNSKKQLEPDEVYENISILIHLFEMNRFVNYCNLDKKENVQKFIETMLFQQAGITIAQIPRRRFVKFKTARYVYLTKNDPYNKYFKIFDYFEFDDKELVANKGDVK